jgi:hypothetical protein
MFPYFDTTSERGRTKEGALSIFEAIRGEERISWTLNALQKFAQTARICTPTKTKNTNFTIRGIQDHA